MPTTRARIPEALHTIVPWILSAAACLIALVILSSFIDTLHLSIRRGETLREVLAQQDATRSNATTQMADAHASGQVAKP